MPDFPEQGRNCPAEKPLPEGEAPCGAEEIAGPQVPAAEAEGGIDPADEQLQTDEKLAEAAAAGLQGPDGVGPRPQQDPRQKAGRYAPEHQLRGQRSRLRFGRGSS